MWLLLAIACTVGYHLVLKLTPAGVNPLFSLMVTYAGDRRVRRHPALVAGLVLCLAGLWLVNRR